ncbi:MAG TPA: hypothetical protein VG602_02560, partial [Actinomycetota bacterium]|nr:hypothetical protein [Actinomycetota bacterium]
LIFVAVVSSFYGTIQDRVPGVDTSSQQFRRQVAPLNPPDEAADPAVAAAARDASTEAFHLAVLVASALLLLGAAVNGFGIRNPPRAERESQEAKEPDAPLPVHAPTAVPDDPRMRPEQEPT